MDTELLPFKRSRNDLFLLILFIMLMTLKLIYVLKISMMLDPNSLSIDGNSRDTNSFTFDHYVDCMTGNKYTN